VEGGLEKGNGQTVRGTEEGAGGRNRGRGRTDGGRAGGRGNGAHGLGVGRSWQGGLEGDGGAEPERHKEEEEE